MVPTVLAMNVVSSVLGMNRNLHLTVLAVNVSSSYCVGSK